MLKIAIVALFMVLLSANETDASKNNVRDSYVQKEICIADITDVNRKGCCSSHGGVCGCEGKREQCCDGTLSPKCKCEE